jgi:nitrate reductase molybdenum cofactor assembly chaperone NarJ/NarW
MFALSSPPPISRSLRVLAALLAYPDAQLRAHLCEMWELLVEEDAVLSSRRAELHVLMNTLQDADPLETEAAYVELFDRGRATSLHLFEHVHGDSRDRGPAMIDLCRTYEAAGLFLTPTELPDYLPTVLEFASTQPAREARAFLGEIVHILNALFGALCKRESAYASVLGALIELAGEKAQPVEPAADDALDESWSEPPAFDRCSAKGQARPGQGQPIHVVRSVRPSGPDANPLAGGAI